jgi:hypothetical protein
LTSINGIQHNINSTLHNAECRYAERHSAECHDYLNIMLNVVMLSVIVLSVVVLSVVVLNVVVLIVVVLNVAMLNVVAPLLIDTATLRIILRNS